MIPIVPKITGILSVELGPPPPPECPELLAPVPGMVRIECIVTGAMLDGAAIFAYM